MNNLLRYIIPTVQFLKKYKYFFISIFSVFTIAFIISCSSSVDRNYGLRDRSVDKYVADEEPLDNDNNDRRSSRRRSSRRRSRSSRYNSNGDSPTRSCDINCKISEACETLNDSTTQISECTELVQKADIEKITQIFSSISVAGDEAAEELLKIGGSNDDAATTDAELDDQDDIFSVYLYIYGNSLPNTITKASRERASSIIQFLNTEDDKQSYTYVLSENDAGPDILNALLKKAITLNTDSSSTDDFCVYPDITNLRIRSLAPYIRNPTEGIDTFRPTYNSFPSTGTRGANSVEIIGSDTDKEQYRRFFCSTDQDADTTNQVNTNIFSLIRSEDQNPFLFKLAYTTLKDICQNLVVSGRRGGETNYCITFVTCWSLEREPGTIATYPLHNDIPPSVVLRKVIDTDNSITDLINTAVDAVIAAERAVDGATSKSNNARSAVTGAKDKVALITTDSLYFTIALNTLFNTAVIAFAATPTPTLPNAKIAFNVAVDAFYTALDNYTTANNSCRLWRLNNNNFE